MSDANDDRRTSSWDNGDARMYPYTSTSFLKLRWRTRLRLWWRRRRIGELGRALEDDLSAREDRALLYGDTTGAPGRHTLSGAPMSRPPDGEG